MTRVSLREAYDNKDVVAQIYAIRDTAESAEDTAEQAVTTANTASDHVDALVPQVEQAVENANTASETVAGYENRLGAVETGLSQTESDLNAVTLRVTTAEGDIVTIQGRVTALETADGQNVKIDRINDYAVGLTGNQDNILGNKTFNGLITKKGSRDKGYVQIKDTFYDGTGANQEKFFQVVNSADVPQVYFALRRESNGIKILRAVLLNSDNTTNTTIELGRST